MRGGAQKGGGGVGAGGAPSRLPLVTVVQYVSAPRQSEKRGVRVGHQYDPQLVAS